MDQPAKPFTSDGADARRWMGRILIAVILGDALWALIVSVMNSLVVPWLGDVMGQSSGLPTSFTQRPYNYPDLFVSILEVGIAGLVAAILNYFFQPRAAKIKTAKSPVPAAPAGPVRVLSQYTVSPAPSPVVPAAPVATTHAAIPPGPVSVAPVAPAPQALSPIAGPIAVAPPAPAVVKPAAAKPQPPALRTEPAKPKKPKEVYYNIVGEPMPSDED
jgi:hypothetical protein